ncbi:hypothetical protein Patl1_21880 [Pistacia atlantica]|uniref:Uncharacterized protein n=1 Tax=Pistacia atlantica TaxID=434234 RepID=A0ACC1BIE3_9ROSI|nr:hypothetical protein Patl1_21880 [Pistacia atlantica]
MAQWESARLEAEARLVRESKLRSHSFHSSSSTSAPFMNKTAAYTAAAPTTIGQGGDLESPTSTLSFSETNNNNNNNNNNVAAGAPVMSGTATTTGIGVNSINMIEFVGSSGSSHHHHQSGGIIKEEEDQLQDWKYKEGIENSLSFTSSLHDMTISMENPWTPESLRTNSVTQIQLGSSTSNMEENFTNLLLNDSMDDGGRALSDSCKDSENSGGGSGCGSGGGSDSGSDYYQDNKNYWNSILNLVNSSPSNSPLF